MNLTSQEEQNKRNHLFDDNEDFDFKPLSDGLGFHHEEKIKVSIQAQPAKQNISRAIRLSSAQPSFETVKPSYIQSDLSLFYENSTKSEEQTELVEAKSYPEALKTTRFAAYALDLFFVSLVTFLTLSVVSKFTGIDFVEQMSAMEEMSLLSVGFIFFSYYFIYFTLLEKMQGKTLGMDLFGIQINRDKELSIIDIFFYEAVVLLGFFSMGLTNFLNLPQIICGIKLIEKK